MNTKLPWEIRIEDNTAWIASRDTGQRVCSVGHLSDSRAADDAALIVRAVNALEPLTLTLDGAVALMETLHDARDSDDPWIIDLYATLQAALKLAREGSPW